MNLSIFTVLNQAKQTLETISTTPELDAEILLTHVLAQSRGYLFAHPEQMLDEAHYQQYLQLLTKRQQGIPVAYIINKKEFWSMSLYVNEQVLIPRPETELVVETVLQLLPAKELLTIADLGTGSGAIALALALERPQWLIYATDNNAKALQIAKKNAENLNITNIKFLLSDWCENLTTKFIAIVSNPPYIVADDPELDQYVAKYEPREALVTPTGLEAIETIMEQGRTYLNQDGLLLFEHGYKQAKAVADLFAKYGYVEIECRQDYANLNRVSFAHLRS